MTITTHLHHLTHYTYDRPVGVGMQTIRLRPAPHTRAKIKSYSLNITPEKHFINWQQDPFGNFLASVVFPDPITEFKIEVDVISQLEAFNPFDFFMEESAQSVPFTYDDALKKQLSPYLEISDRAPIITEWIEKNATQTGQNTIDYLVDINQKLANALTYTIRMEPGVQTSTETLTKKSGSCRDMAWLLCQILRHKGLASRFTSGYLIQLKADEKALDGPSGTEQDFTDLHAWTEVFIPGAGWIGLDPTSGLFASEGHIPLCATPSPISAAPVSGTIGLCNSTLTHEMSITRIHEDIRMTKPFSEATWDDIDALSQKVDNDLKTQDVRLTMGGEPTFIAIDDPDGEEWHFTALSNKKTKLAENLIKRLRASFAPNGLLQFTQGKWYPGEELPRWAMHCYSRKDGSAFWNKLEHLLPTTDPDLNNTAAQNFLATFARALGIPETYILHAVEDTPYYLWAEDRLPESDKYFETDTTQPKQRDGLLKSLRNNLNTTKAFVLPIHPSPTRERWISNHWRFRSGKLVLSPGTSPAGLRLPLGSLPHSPKSADETNPERDPTQQNTPLPNHKLLIATANKKHKETPDDTSFKEDPNGLITTAIVAEIRDGKLHLFMPPTQQIEHFLELVAALEVTCAHLNQPIVLEGYPPPKDLRIQHFSVTPDPGVIEVNTHPAHSWNELKHITTTLYEDARQSRLKAEKYLHDGRRIGTGGGNHIVLGGKTPEDSPFLRRPDLLQSLITFWQHHPSLSYLFASQYIGPTSQAPRVDEARHDTLTELELAFAQIPKSTHSEKKLQPWQLDRLLRNLLIDLSGNTHRAEFCIDKLFNPASTTGRLGLLEMRGFEMMPHARLNLLQAALIRALIATFWRKPYTDPLIRWGERLHDEFMLPHFIEHDFHTVLQYLHANGYPFQKSWFAPCFAFRFPEYGTLETTWGTLTLTHALEPWHVMGEDLSATGVSRAVDSTLERLQVSISAPLPKNMILTVNTTPIALKSTGQNTLIAGVRYKAWSQPSSLHPALPVNTPLVFDLVDTQTSRAVAGCTYYVSHPGGRSFDTTPINNLEAEGRRLARFVSTHHTSGKITIKEIMRPAERITLDLRYQNF